MVSWAVQIADVGNARLNDQERADVEDVFKKALKIREDELKSWSTRHQACSTGNAARVSCRPLWGASCKS